MAPFLTRVWDGTTKGVFGADIHAGLRRHRTELVDLYDDSALGRPGLVDVDALRAACLGPHASTSLLIALDPTLACEIWLRSLDRSALPTLVRASP